MGRFKMKKIYMIRRNVKIYIYIYLFIYLRVLFKVYGLNDLKMDIEVNMDIYIIYINDMYLVFTFGYLLSSEFSITRH